MGPDVMFIFFVLLLLLIYIYIYIYIFFFGGGGGGRWVCWVKVGGRGADIHSNPEVSGTRENR